MLLWYLDAGWIIDPTFCSHCLDKAAYVPLPPNVLFL